MTEEADSKQVATADLQKLFSGLPPRYEFGSILGTGGTGVVFRARDLHLDRDVAIKVLFLNEAQNDSTKKRFVQEAKTLATLNHPNIVKLLSYGESEQGALYEVMEFIDGKTLATELKEEGRLNSARFFEVFSQIATGLQDAHDKMLIHRDLKPSNIVICKADTEPGFIVKIIDFGLAKNPESNPENDKLTKTNTAIGTPLYMSPEQCRGIQLDQRSDIYSLGCMMYEALTGKPPFEGGSAMELAYKHVNADYEHLEDIASMKESKLLGKLVDDCLAKDPSSRPKSSNDVLKELKKIASQRDDSLKLFAVKEKRKKTNSSLLIAVSILSILTLGFSAKQLFEYRKRLNEYAIAQARNQLQPDSKAKQNRPMDSEMVGMRDIP
ncbi:MAG: serine/threonine protein kinase, partial [Candidatus Obscuribacterales bacterium]|nr:serine/threonine protein kinase [Candidatus Obscuribacterales bacterium]